MACLNKWSDKDSREFVAKLVSKGVSRDLALRTYSARLLGSDPELVLHGGGNTSVKTSIKDIFGNDLPVICVKGSGWDLATIEPEGHPSVKIEPLLKLKDLSSLSDEEMVSVQRQNLLNPNSPNPSVETLLHAFLPYKFVDHTHSIALLSLANQPNSFEICKNIFGDRLVIVPYVMPGFDLALAANKYFLEAIDKNKKNNNKTPIEGMILLNHGLFTFGDNAKESYGRMIKIVQEAENLINRKIDLDLSNNKFSEKLNSTKIKIISCLRGLISHQSKKFGVKEKWIFDLRSNQKIQEFLKQENLSDLCNRGVATPDHVIRTKAKPLVLGNVKSFKHSSTYEELKDWLQNAEKSLENYINDYLNYFDSNNLRFGNSKKRLDPIPRIILIPGIGLVGINHDKKSAKITSDIGEAWLETLLSAEKLGKFVPVDEKDTFDLEYWSLEQAKLGNKKNPKLKGNVVVITGAGGTIGSAIAKEFSREGAEIVSIDINSDDASATAQNCGSSALSIKCDITNESEVDEAFNKIIMHFGGVDILISNAGIAIKGDMKDINKSDLNKSLEINLFSHFYMAKKSVEIFRIQDFASEMKGNYIGGQLLFNISKQSLNPGPGFGAYGISKTALLALMKQYAIEEGPNNVRSNCINADRIRSGLLNSEMIKNRSKARGLSEKQYMSGNLLRSEVNASDVAKAFVALSLMKKTTGTILTVDGGNVAAMPR